MIGVFDSGLGGLSVVREILDLDPDAHVLYVGDRAWAPYGERSLADVRQRAEAITDHLLDEGADTVVVACNTASAAALTHLRSVHPGRCFVGMEPAVKPAAALTRTGVVGVLATPATFQGALYASVVDRYAEGLEVIAVPCPGWMEMVEHPVDDATRRASIDDKVLPLVAAGADVVVLGCTHYPFLRTEIEKSAGPGVVVVDPGEAVAKQVVRTAVPDRRRGVRVTVTGPTDGVADRIRTLTGLELPVESVTFLGSDL